MSTPTPPPNMADKPRVKRSRLSPWNTAAASKRPPTNNVDSSSSSTSPLPPRVVSDVIPSPLVRTSTPEVATPKSKPKARPPIASSPWITSTVSGGRAKVGITPGTPSSALSTASSSVRAPTIDVSEQQPPRAGIMNPTVASNHPKVAALQRKWEQGKSHNASVPGYPGLDVRSLALMRSTAEGRRSDADDDEGSSSTDSSTDSSDDEGPPPAPAVSVDPEPALGRRTTTQVPLPSYAFSHTQSHTTTQSQSTASLGHTSSVSVPEDSRQTMDTQTKAQSLSQTATHQARNTEALNRARSTAEKTAYEEMPPQKIMSPPVSTPEPKMIAQIHNTSSESFESSDWATVNGQMMPIMVTSSEGRLYREYKDSHGTIMASHGSLIPNSYEILHTPHSQWVCPVRDCRKRLKNLSALGAHFSPAHKRQAFNDNGDGTLSLVGPYVSTGKTSPAIVVSAIPIAADAPPPVEPSFPVNAQTQRDDSIATSDSAATHTSKPIPAQSGLQVASHMPTPIDGDDPITYLTDILGMECPIPQRGDVEFMGMLRRKRDLPDAWIQYHTSKPNSIDATHYACALAYVVGEEVAENACTKSYTTGRLSSPCIKLPEIMAFRDKQTFSQAVTCVGCKYQAHLQRQTNTCDWHTDMVQPRNGKKRRRGKRESAVASSDEVEILPDSSTPPAPVWEASQVKELTTEDRMMLDSLSPARNRLRDPVPPVIPEAVPDPVSKRRSGRLDKGERQSREIRVPRQDRASQPESASPEECAPQQEVAPVDGILKMEDWEFAPGRQVDSSTKETVAFSSVYLTGTKSVIISEDIGFNRLRIPPGGSHDWQADDNTLRYCEVISGKVEVKYPETALTVGPGGIFILRPGMSCTAENRRYVEAVLSCHTNSNYSYAQ